MRLRIALLAGTLLILACRQPPATYNRYAPVLHEPMLETADDLVQGAHDLLDTIDQRVENIVY